MIGHNESKNLKRSLESVKWADQIVFVDCGSEDDSLKTAAAHGAETFSVRNDPNLNVNKQYGLDQCRCDWIFYLDPDESISAELKFEILSAISGAAPGTAAFTLPRRNHYMGRWLRHGGKYPDTQLRLFRNKKARFPCVHVHEKISIDGDIGELRNPLDHFPYAAISEMLSKSDFYTSRKAEYLYASNREMKHYVLRGIGRFFRDYILRLGALDGEPGAAAAIMDAYNEIFAGLKLKEMKRNKPDAKG